MRGPAGADDGLAKLPPNQRPENCPRSKGSVARCAEGLVCSPACAVLTLGDGDFSFSLSLATLFSSAASSSSLSSSSSSASSSFSSFSSSSSSSSNIGKDKSKTKDKNKDKDTKGSVDFTATSHESHNSVLQTYPDGKDNVAALSRLGVCVLHEVDATDLQTQAGPSGCLAGRKFDLVSAKYKM
jgi:hypothetical protein